MIKSGLVLFILTIPKETNPAFADDASTGAPFSSEGGEEDHEQGGALISPAVCLASTNSWIVTKFKDWSDRMENLSIMKAIRSTTKQLLKA